MFTENDIWLRGHPEKIKYLNSTDTTKYDFDEIDTFTKKIISLHN